jgi:short subunit dehydrogenase-like uncharacterized protein
VTADSLLVYGASGYTGRLVVQGALDLGLRPILAGRNAAKLAAIAEPLGLEHRVASLHDPSQLDAALRDVPLVLHAAGPYSETARPMVEACLRAGAHYLDVSGEVDVIEELASRHAEARARRIVIMPAVGFDVVASDCLGAHVARRLPGATRLVFGLRGLTLAARGSMKTAIEQMGRPTPVRRNRRVTHVPPLSLVRTFDYGDGPRSSVAVSWGDVATTWYTTGIGETEVYFEESPVLRTALTASLTLGPLLQTGPWQAWLKMHCDFLWPPGPSEAERAAIRTVIVAEASNGNGRVVRSRLHAPQAYTLTARTAPAIARRVLAGDTEFGFQTPGRVYGSDFVLGFDGVSREDLP